MHPKSTVTGGGVQMTKIFKRYDFGLSLPGVKGGSMAFSSYPGELFSDDDLYMMGGSQLTVTSTTLHLLDEKIYRGLVPETLVTALLAAGSVLCRAFTCACCRDLFVYVAGCDYCTHR